MVLLSSGASADLRNRDSETPLQRAVHVHDPLGRRLVTMLLNFARELDAMGDFGRTALNEAVEAGNARLHPAPTAIGLAAAAL